MSLVLLLNGKHILRFQCVAIDYSDTGTEKVPTDMGFGNCLTDTCI